jgi:hypothetical protein
MLGLNGRAVAVLSALDYQASSPDLPFTHRDRISLRHVSLRQLSEPTANAKARR